MTADTHTQTRWREARGTIVKSEVAFDSEDYRPVVEYTYEVDGVAYRGGKIAFGPLIQFNWRGPAARAVARYPVGSVVTVYVDPANPRRASLQPGRDRNFRPFLIITIAFAVLMIALLLRSCSTA
jgi:hypothetical protein